MNYRIIALLLSLALCFCLFSCGGEVDTDVDDILPVSSDTVTLYVYNWGEYISDGSEDSLDSNAEFEKYFNENLASKYGHKIRVNYSTYSSNEDMYAKVSSGAVAYDVIIPSDYMIERMIKEGLLRKLNFDNIPNSEYIEDEFRNLEYDPTNEYSIPYSYGMVGIIYNTSIVSEDDPDIGSWDLMFNPESAYKGDILQFNNSRDAFGTALYKLGLDVNDTTRANWEAALELLKRQKSIVQGYVMDEIYNKMESGSAAIAAYYAGDYLTMYEDNEDLEFFYPSEGTNYYIDAFCVPYNSKNPALAEEYINFMLSEEPAVANAEYTYYASPNSLVVKSEEYREYLSGIKDNAYDILYNGIADGYYISAYRNLDDDGLQMMNDLWEELKVESPVSTTIFVICGIIIAAIAAFAIGFAIRRKKRAIVPLERI